MKYLKKYKNIDLSKFAKHSLNKIKILELIYKYNKDIKNFPENENIKEIFKEIFDWYYLNNRPKPVIGNQIYRIENKNDIYSIEEDIRNIYDGDAVGFIESSTYYKTYRIDLTFIKKEIVENFSSLVKRSENYGFYIKIHENNYGTFIFIIDIGDPITLKEIIDEAYKNI